MGGGRARAGWQGRRPRAAPFATLPRPPVGLLTAPVVLRGGRSPGRVSARPPCQPPKEPISSSHSGGRSADGVRVWLLGSRSPTCVQPTHPVRRESRTEASGGSLRGSPAWGIDMVAGPGGLSPSCGGCRFETPSTLSAVAHASQAPPPPPRGGGQVDGLPVASVPTAGARGVRGGACTCDGVDRPTLPEGGGAQQHPTGDNARRSSARAAGPVHGQAGESG